MTNLAAQGSNLRRWRESPATMVRELFNVEPDSWQLDALDLFPKSPRLAMQACAGPGKTAVLAWICWNFLLTRPHPMVGATSVTGDNLKANLWTELARWRERTPVLQAAFEMTKSEIYARDHPTTWRCEARTWAKDANAEQIGNALRGLHSDFIMWLCDESGDYPDSIMPVLENIFAGNPKEAHIVQAGNPTKLGGPLYRAATVARELWRLIRITGDPDDPKRSPRIGLEHAREQIRQYGRDNPWVMINILGQFPPSSLNALIGPDEVQAAMGRYYREYEIGRAPKILGVDVAREGDDTSVIASRHGIQMFPLIQKRNLTSDQGAGIVARQWSEWGADACFIDMTGGFGAGWYDHLVLLKRSPIGVQFAGEPHDTGRYYNKRTEMAFDFINWVKRGGALPNSPRLLTAMTQTTYTFKGDTMLLEPKEAIKKKIGFSPDEFDASMLTFAEPVALPQRASRGLVSAIAPNYDVFGPSLGNAVSSSYNEFPD